MAAISGLAGLTGPAWNEPVAGVIDVVVFGAKSDGKTQFITHAIRTLEGVSPAGLSASERQQNEMILNLVVNAKRPAPQANPDRNVRHYVFRAKADKIWEGMSTGDRLASVWRSGAVRGYAILALLSAIVTGAALFALRGGVIDQFVAAGAAISLLAGLWMAHAAARRAVLSRGEVEVCFWDVAGEDVYSDRGAGGYHSFLDMLARARRIHATAGGGPPRGHAMAPILMCNPISVGTRAEDSSYARLRLIMPTFASLQRPHPDVLVVVNRWRLVRAVCASGSGDVDDIVAVVPVARDVAAATSAGGPRDPMPCVRRSVVLKHCRDGDPPEVGSTRFVTVSYEAGLDPAVEEAEWKSYDDLPADVRARWGPPAETGVKSVLTYTYSEGPGALGGETAQTFFGWMAKMLWAKPADPSEEAAEAPVFTQQENVGSGTVKMYAVDPRAPLAGDERAARSGAVENPGGFRSSGR